MSKIINIGYNVAKVWAILWAGIIIFGTSGAIQSIQPSFSEFLFYSFIQVTIMMIPLAIMRYIKSQKQKELRNALH